MKHALFLPPFGPLSEPDVLVDLAVAAEAAGWDGVFLWDHVVYREPVTHVADPWIALAAIAQATERIRIGTMVTPLPRRRPHVLARQITTLDRLSGGRVTLGVGIGGDGYGEFSTFGDQADARVRGAMLDEELALVRELWSGREVHHDGDHHLVDGARFLPTPVQSGGPPVWAAARFGNRTPLLRAARLDGVFPIDLDSPDDLRTLVDEVADARDEAGLADQPFDVCVNVPAGTDPAAWERAGATWGVPHLGPFQLDEDDLRRVAASSPPAWPTEVGW